MKPSPGPWAWEVPGHEAEATLVDSMGGVVMGTQDIVRPDDQVIIALAPEMRDTLLRLEWSGSVPLYESDGCPSCHGAQDPDSSADTVGHEAGCAFASLLDKLR